MSPDAAAPPKARILVVDDDPGVRELLCEFLARHGYEAGEAADAARMDEALAARAVDLVVLDVMMPGEDGLSICKRLSSRPGPAVVMLSAMGEETDRIVGLELGADDYLPKPCNPRELLARVRAVLRRRGPGAASPEAERDCISFAGWRLDLIARTLTGPDGTDAPLTNGEFRLLRAFAERPRRVLTREQLLDLARGPDSETFDRAIDVQISRLRRKFHDGSGADFIVTLRGEGYMFAADTVRR